MRITKLIKVYTKLLPLYTKALTEGYNYVEEMDLYSGLCMAAQDNCGTSKLYKLFDATGYYRNYMFDEFGDPTDMLDGIVVDYDNYKPGIQHRVDFMKRELRSLNYLLKKGYTHV